MYRRRSDLWLLALCTVPVLIGTVLYVNYQSTGALPFGVPAFRLPSISFPSIPAADRLLPPSAQNAAQTVKSNLALFVAGITAACLVIIMLAGICTDFMVARRQALARKAAEGLEVEHPLDAPWLETELPDS